MIKKLRIKFTVLATISAGIVLAVMVFVINMMNYQNVIHETDTSLDILSEHQISGKQENKIEGADQEGKGPDEAKPSGMDGERYFCVEVDSDSNISYIETGKFTTIDESVAKAYGRKADAKEGQAGFVSDYRYKKYETEGKTYIIFLDCSRSLMVFRNFLTISIFVSVTGEVLILLIMIFASKRIVRPFAENYEKQKRFITDAGHEIKTPLTIIDADAAVLEMECGENEWIKDIGQQTQRLKELTNDLIYLSKMEEMQTEVQMVEFPLSEMIQEMVGSFQTLATSRGKELECQIEPMVSLTGSPKDIQRLISILLDNAVKYTNEDGQIFLRLTQKGNQKILTVFNTVDEIDVEQVPHLFDRFYRLDASRNKETGGYGIGLSIGQAVVQMHKGKITAESPDGKSLTIKVTFS